MKEKKVMLSGKNMIFCIDTPVMAAIHDPAATRQAHPSTNLIL
jgi:hypothetical protein